MNAATTINLGNIDQTTGDVTAITNFENVDASALSAAISITGACGRQYHHRRLGRRHDRWRRRCRYDLRPARAMIRWPIAAPNSRLTAAPAPTRCSCSQLRLSIWPMPTRRRAISPPSPTSRMSTPRCSPTGVSITGSSGVNVHHRFLRQRHHRRRRRRRYDRGRRRQRLRDLPRHGNVDRRRQRLRYAGAVDGGGHHVGQFRGRGRPRIRPPATRVIGRQFRKSRRQRSDARR